MQVEAPVPLFVPVQVRMPTTVEDIPSLSAHAFDNMWQSDRKRLLLQVDCRSVAELCAGRAVLSSPELRPVFVRICRHIHEIHRMRWRPMQDCFDLVMWAPREYNTVADHCCNVSMDLKKSWTVSDNAELADALLNDQCLRLCVDGGRRSSSEGALGLALFSVTGMEVAPVTHTLLARKGQLLSSVASAFEAEAIALEWALQYLLQLLKGSVTIAQQQ